MILREAIRSELSVLGAAELRPFDAHSHTGADVDGSTRSWQEHSRDLDGIDGRSVVFPLCVTTGYGAENQRVVEECRNRPDRLLPYARLDPNVTAAAGTAAALGSGARGIKLHPRAEAFELGHPNVDAILGVAAEAGVPVLIHAGVGVGSFGPVLTELAERHRGCPIVLAHAGISDLVWLWRVVPDHPNLFFDTAWWNPADLLALFALVPPGRILFGSDAPYMDVELGLAITLRCARFAGLSEEAVELIAGDQLARLLDGEAPVDAGPAAGPAPDLAPGEGRLASLLTAVGGCLLGGGDPTNTLALAALAVASDSPPLLAELIAEARSSSPEAIRALALALTMAATPSVGREAAVV